MDLKIRSADVRLAEAHITDYVTEIDMHQSFRPFGFLANGCEINLQQNNADQIGFLRLVQSAFLLNCHMHTADPDEPPLAIFGADVVERWFIETEISETVKFMQELIIQ